MPPRQLLVFRIGCVATLLCAVLHLVGHISGGPPAANDTEVKLLDLASSYKFSLPGGVHRSIMDFQNGYSLSFAMLLGTIGATGIIVAKRGQQDLLLILAVARQFAVASTLLTVIALTHFFIIPSMCFALMAVCFAIASVAPPEPI
jgi:hypothetical protein